MAGLSYGRLRAGASRCEGDRQQGYRIVLRFDVGTLGEEIVDVDEPAALRRNVEGRPTSLRGESGGAAAYGVGNRQCQEDRQHQPGKLYVIGTPSPIFTPISQGSHGAEEFKRQPNWSGLEAHGV
jgi:hypothetical protein